MNIKLGGPATASLLPGLQRSIRGLLCVVKGYACQFSGSVNFLFRYQERPLQWVLSSQLWLNVEMGLSAA